MNNNMNLEDSNVSDLKVIVVDDDAGVRRVIARNFVREGFTVADAPNGEKALEMINKEHFDIMICDISMPKMSGKELCEHLAAEGPYLPACTCIVTSCADSEQRDWVSGIPGIDLIEKPVGPRQLLRHVKERLMIGTIE